MKKNLLLLMALGMLFTFAHCKKDNDDTKKENPLGQYHELYKKWWYNQAQFRGDHFFTPTDSTQGSLEWIHFNQMVFNGTYQWYPSGDSMWVQIPTFDPLVFYFKFLTPDSMGYSPNNEPENIYRFKLTKP